MLGPKTIIFRVMRTKPSFLATLTNGEVKLAERAHLLLLIPDRRRLRSIPD